MGFDKYNAFRCLPQGGREPSWRRVQRAVAAILFAVWLAIPFAGRADAASPTEYQLKAAFLFNFAKFVEWPPSSFRNDQSPITICVLGEDLFGPVLEETVKAQTVGNRGLAVKRITRVSRDDACHILFVSSSEEHRLDQILGRTQNWPVLTVGDIAIFTAVGGIINLVLEEKKVRFEVNLDAAERAGLKISSRLLRLAKHVYERKKN